VQRATLVVRISIDPTDVSIAAAAGIATGGLTVRVQRGASTDAPRLATTSQEGVARFEGLTQGNYEISVDRPLTVAELARLAPADRDASIFSGGAAVAVTPPSRETSIELVAARRGSLIISELFLFSAQVPGVGDDGHYVEVYNNADTTIYLDGVVIFRTSFTANCEERSVIRLDENGIWSWQLHQFPGSGSDYPIRPGEARVQAIDAIDHRPISSQLLDLSTAEFEIIGDGSDPNNPFAADMIRLVGNGVGHGESFRSDNLVGIALPIAGDTTRLEKSTSPGIRYFKVPREAIIDVATITYSPERFALLNSVVGLQRCEPYVALVHERAPALLGDGTLPVAVARKTLVRSSAGVEILQRTRNSARDFEYAQPLRRSLRRPR
jgi:hypothetical protein